MFKTLWGWLHGHKSQISMALLIYYIIAAAVILIGSLASPNLYDKEGLINMTLTGPFRISEDSVELSNTALPHSITNKSVKVIEVSSILSKTDFPSTSLVTTIYQTQLEVELDGELLYKSPGIPGGVEHFSPGSARVSVPLPNDFAGRTLTLRYHRFVLGDSSSIQPVILENTAVAARPYMFSVGDKVMFFSMSVIACAGLLLAIVSVMLSPRKFFRQPLLYLAIFMMTTPVWLLCNTKLIQFFILNPVLIQNLEYIAFYSFMLPLWAFIRKSWSFCPKASRFALYLLVTFNALTLTAKLLHVADFFAFLPLYHLVLATNALLLGYCALQSRKSTERSLQLFFNGFFFACLAGFADLARFYFFPAFTPMFSVIGILALAFCVIASYIDSARQIVQIKSESRIYKEMAHTDPLTGLPNRLAFDRDMSQLEQRKIDGGSILFANLDINRFKQINDSYGHLEGDRVLKIVAQQLQSLFRGVAVCYRMGGDEFSLIATGDESALELKNLLEKLNENLNQSTEEIPVSVAYGIAEYSSVQCQDLIETFRAADDRMYLHKRGSAEKR